MDAFKLLRKKFSQQSSEGTTTESKIQKGPKVAPKPKIDNVPKPAASKGATGTDTKGKPKDNPVHKDLVNLKHPVVEKKRIHVTEEKATLTPTPKSASDRKSSLPEEKLQELQEAFVLFDKNQDGMITKEELGAVLHALGQRPTVSEVQALIHSVDLDKSGTIDFEEFVKIFSTKLSIDPEKELHEVFCIFDENGDGFISSDELYSMLHKLGEHITKHEAQKMINEADLNRDGKVDYREFKAILNAR
ncbi:calmodulin-beta-like isoform X1 [Ruditapes philippinarum]|uniref:calmodulin-beta-like isoform X1 n=1 Tax=Ruditapes philippinarum TaxID=129788 RepID=UPI00295A7901|nr:calmodulin-beta-like isoform X1 [Ruditapes philippinarum]